jgi:GntR family transcriptional repressor for pyruvate dehydrogenase complex
MTDTPDDTGHDLFHPVIARRISQVIVDQIKQLLRDGKLADGDRLPSERELGQRFGVSRVTVREALRILEAAGLMTIKVGAHGGAFVAKPTSRLVSEGLADLVALSPVTPAHVTEARRILEIGVLPLAVERATEADIAYLRRVVDESTDALERDEYRTELSAEFHVGVARCAQNAAIVALVESFHGPMLSSLRLAHEAAPVMAALGVADHADLLHAIETRNLESAVAIMTRHLERMAGVAEGIGPADLVAT